MENNNVETAVVETAVVETAVVETAAQDWFENRGITQVVLTGKRPERDGWGPGSGYGGDYYAYMRDAMMKR
jgi:hypothetical protein